MNLKVLIYRWNFVFLILILSGAFTHCEGEVTQYKISITDIKRVVHKNWLTIPKSVDCTVIWELYEQTNGGWIQVDPNVFNYFKVICKSKKNDVQIETSEEVKGNYYTFFKKDVGQKYGIIVEGYKANKLVAVSDSAWILTGKLRADKENNGFNWIMWIPFNGRIPLKLIGNERFFDGATPAGKTAFHVIWNFFIIGLVIWLGFCWRHLSLKKVFPLEKGLVFGRGYDEIFRRKESREFRAILDDWREVVISANKNIRIELSQGDKFKTDDIASVNTRFWRDRGTEAIHSLIKRISNSILDRYPTVKIIKAGLENHELGGYHWLEVSKEVDRAIENRASSELEKLRRKSFLDWLWNLGTLSPLIGLFGTATGISHAFAQLTYLPRDVTQTELVKRLAGGIYEALWTTIEGLAIGVLLMILYYYYQNKLNWIYAKWEEIYVDAAEKL
jgi:biopolymer transport protein ExbB/TolQ